MRIFLFVSMIAFTAAQAGGSGPEQTAAPAAASPALNDKDKLSVRALQLKSERLYRVLADSSAFKAFAAAQEELSARIKAVTPPGYQLIEDEQTGDLKLTPIAKPASPGAPGPAKDAGGKQ